MFNQKDDSPRGHTAREKVNDMEAFYGILIPFLGTSLGAACVFFMKKSLSDAVQRSLTGFAAGAMLYDVVEELIPEMSQGTHSNIGTVFFAVVFSLMIVLDVALG